MRITAIYDNGTTKDRYTILTDSNSDGNRFRALLLSSNPDDKFGISDWDIAIAGEHLGHRIRFEHLAENVQAHIAKRIFGK